MYALNVNSKSSRRNENIKIANSQVKLIESNWVIDLKYGYEYHLGNLCTEGFDSVMPGQKYRIMHEWHPRENDIITDLKSGRIFKVGEVTGFVFYEAPLMEDNHIVAILRFEDYYKD